MKILIYSLQSIWKGKNNTFMPNFVNNFIFAALFVFFSSCSSIDRAAGSSLLPVNIGGKPNRHFNRNFNSEDIKYALMNKDFFKAAVIFSQLIDLDKQKQREYMTLIKEGLGILFQETIKNKGILASLPHYYSLQSLGIAERYISQNAFAKKLFNYYITKKYFGAALNFAQTSLLGDIQLEDKIKIRFQNFIQEQFSNNPSIDNSDFWEERIKGTVTVFVKLGNKRIPYTRLHLPLNEVGSGFFIDNSGSIITNYHVISSQATKNTNLGNIFVKLSARDELIPARLVGWDKNRDLALLRISRSAPYLLNLSSNFNLMRYKNLNRKTEMELFTGNEVYAIGAPGGLENTLTSGRMSARNRRLLPLTEAFQVDVPASPGSSGGPLLNNRGAIEGVIFAKTNSGLEGIAFAIPSNTLSSVLPRLYLGGAVKNSWLGLVVDEYNGSQDYLEIRYVFPNSPASQSLLKSGMRIISYRNNNYTKISALQSQVANGPVGSLVDLTVQDPENGKNNEVFLELQTRPEKPMYANLGQESTVGLFYALFGAQLEAMVNRRNSYRITAILPYSQVSQLNIQEGDYIQIIQWLTDVERNIIIAHISYNHKDDVNTGGKQSVLIEPLDMLNII